MKTSLSIPQLLQMALVAAVVVLIMRVQPQADQTQQAGFFNMPGYANSATAPTNSTGFSTSATLLELNNALVNIAEKSNPAVVTILTEREVRNVRRNPFEDFFGSQFRSQPRRMSGLGSGVIVSGDGYILTNNHVIDGADVIAVEVLGGETLDATVVGADPKSDLAVLKVEKSDLPYLEFGNSDGLRVGEIVMAIGSPLDDGLAHTVTMGIVSATGRTNLDIADYENFIQTDAAINPGNSGGALVDLNGNLVGINTAIATRSGGNQGIGFAIPASMAKMVMESLIKDGRVIRGYLGIYMDDVNQAMMKALDLKEENGIFVGRVVKGGPADLGGIREEDVIVKLDGRKIKDLNELRNKIAGIRPGTSIDLTVVRNGNERDLTVVLGELDAGNGVAVNSERNEMEELVRFRVDDITGENARNYRIDPDEKGVVVTDIDARSKAYRAGLRTGDLIVALNKKTVNSTSDFVEMVKVARGDDAMLLKVIRSGTPLYIAFDL